MGIRIRKHFNIIFFILLFSGSAWAQGEARIHVVQPKETLYGISRMYNFTIDDLIYFNPDLRDHELKEGMKLVIPSDDRINAIKEERRRAIEDSIKYTFHKVVQGETLYSIKTKYGISIPTLRELNPTLEEQGGLKTGQILRIPRDPENHSEFQVETAALDTGTFKLDANWFYHKIQKQETAYSLSKRYKISLDSLYLLNPRASDGLRIGQWLKLPRNRKEMRPTLVEPNLPEVTGKGKKAKQQRKEIAEIKNTVDTTYVEGDIANSDYFLYKVKSGDTFFSLKQRYDATQEELLALNKELKKGLVVGKYIVVPKKSNSKELSWLERLVAEKEAERQAQEVDPAVQRNKELLNTPKTIEPEPTRDTTLIDINKQYRIAMVLPFRSGMYSDTLGVSGFKPHRDTEMAMQYYLGFLMAADSIRAMGMDLKIKVYDSQANQRKIPSIAKSIDSLAADLVVGPAYGRLVERMADELKDSETPVISPLSAGVAVKGRKNLFQVIPPTESRYARIAELINNYYGEANLIFAHCGSAEEQKQVQLIKAHLNPRSEDFITSIVSCEELQSRWTLRDRMSSIQGQKLVVLLGDDPVFLSDIISKLYVMRDTSIQVIGSPRLLNYPTMELSYLNALKYHTYEFRDINYQDSATQAFIKKFRAAYNADPGAFAFQGYDAGLYFLPKLWRYGYQFPYHLKEEEQSSTGYYWQPSEDGGWENHHLFMSRMFDFRPERLEMEVGTTKTAEGLRE
jgi:LysM repeat protein